MQKPPAVAQPGQVPRPSTPKSGSPQQPTKTFVGMPPAAEPPRLERPVPVEAKHPSSIPPAFDIDMNDDGEGVIVQPPRPKSETASLDMVSELLPILATLECAAIGKAKILTVDLKRIQIKGDRLFIGNTAIGDSGDRKVRIWLDAIGYPINKLPMEILVAVESCFKTGGPLLKQGLANSSRVSLVSDHTGISLCLHRTDDGPAFIKFPARPPESPADKK